MKKYLIFFIILSIIIGVLFGYFIHQKIINKILPSKNAPVAFVPTPLPTKILATPTPKPISFADLNAQYGPCAVIPVLMYHHVQPEDTAKKLNQQNLTVTPDFFKKHLEYLKSHGYTTILPENIINFFDNNISLPKKSVLITLDDAYEDNYQNAYPLLKDSGQKATIFVPTGLVTVPDYLNWDEIKTMASSGLIYFGNHTWSHQSSNTTREKLDMEISTADKQLSQSSLNANKVFAYPYGKPSLGAEETLTKYGYKLAFTTVHGSIACKGKRFDIPRIRIGNAPLSSYGL